MKIFRKLSLGVRLLLVVLPPLVGTLFFAMRLNAQDGIEHNWPLAAGIVLLAGTVALAYLLLASPIRQLSAIHSTFSKLNAGHDLSARVKIEGGETAGVSALAVNQVLDSFTSSMNRYERSNSTILATTQGLCDASGSSNQGLASQRGQMEQFAYSVTELVRAINEVAESSQLAAEATEQARNQTQHGALVATNAMCAIEAVFDDLDNADETIEDLNKRSRDVGVVLEVIGDISEQTNLLALNAAIEAARAGEHGRGFAVVADEVRKLASKTQDSIAQIQQIIDKLQSGAKLAVNRMGQARSKAHEGVLQVEESAESLGTIAGEVVTLMEMNHRIADAASHQSGLADTLNTNLEEIQSLAQENSDKAEMREQLARELLALVNGARSQGDARFSGQVEAVTA